MTDTTMPKPIKVVNNLLVGGFISLASFIAWNVIGVDGNRWTLAPSLLFIAAAIGLYRKVDWGRQLASTLSILVAGVTALSLIPDWDIPPDELQSIEILLGFMPAIWITWLLIVLPSVLLLLPSLTISWRKGWFRDSIW